MLTEVERRYSQCEREAEGDVWACERLWMYLLRRRFTIETDNRAVGIIFANTKSRPPARIERLALRMSQFEFDIVHKPGRTNIGDYYSRQPVIAKRDDFLEEIIASAETEVYINVMTCAKFPRSVTLEEIRIETRLKLITHKRSGPFPSRFKEYEKVVDELNGTEDGILYHTSLAERDNSRSCARWSSRHSQDETPHQVACMVSGNRQADRSQGEELSGV
jgi:hypothetical protein